MITPNAMPAKINGSGGLLGSGRPARVSRQKWIANPRLMKKKEKNGMVSQKEMTNIEMRGKTMALLISVTAGSGSNKPDDPALLISLSYLRTWKGEVSVYGAKDRAAPKAQPRARRATGTLVCRDAQKPTQRAHESR